MNLLKAHRSILINFNVNNIYHEGYETFARKIISIIPERIIQKSFYFQNLIVLNQN